jgi:hypothetical protein
VFRYFLIIVVVLFVFIAFLPAEPTGYNIDVKARISFEDNQYLVYIDGQTNLPEDTRLEAELSYLKTVAVPRAIREEMGKDYEIEPVEMDKGMAEVKKQSCTFKLGYYKRKPYSGGYRIRVFFEPSGQTKQVKSALTAGVIPVEKTIEINFGNPADFESERNNVKQDVYRDLKQVSQLYDQLLKRIDQFKTPIDDKWVIWYQGWQKQVTALEESNHTRLEVSIYWLESAGKNTIKFLLEDLTALVQEFDKTKVSDAFHKSSLEFAARLDDKLYELGYQKIIDTDKVTKLLDALDNTYREIKKQPVAARTQEQVADWQILFKLSSFQLAQELTDMSFSSYIVPLTHDLFDYLKINDKSNNALFLESSIEENLKKLRQYLAEFE